MSQQPNTFTLPLLVTVRQLARHANVHPRTIQRHIRKGVIPARKIPGSNEWRITVEDAWAWLNGGDDHEARS